MLFSLSLRYKLPLLGAALIVLTALTLSTLFLLQAWNNLRQDMLKSSEDLGQTMARSLVTALVQDDVWRAYETVSLPFKDNSDSALAEVVIVLDADGTRAALFVDALVGQHQVVIKSLEANYRRVPGISGATIMGDGHVAMILDVPALVGMARFGVPKSAKQR